MWSRLFVLLLFQVCIKIIFEVKWVAASGICRFFSGWGSRLEDDEVAGHEMSATDNKRIYTKTWILVVKNNHWRSETSTSTSKRIPSLFCSISLFLDSWPGFNRFVKCDEKFNPLLRLVQCSFRFRNKFQFSLYDVELVWIGCLIVAREIWLAGSKSYLLGGLASPAWQKHGFHDIFFAQYICR